jgi:hypothetical protein
MGLFSSGGFFDDVLGLDPSGDGLLGSLGANIITDPLEDGFKSITGQTAEDAFRDSSQSEASELRRIGSLFDPSADLGARQFPALEAGASAEGFGQNIGDLLTGGSLDTLISERQRASQAALSGAGIRRSGVAGTEAARIPADLALQIEGELNRRRQGLAQFGMQGLGQKAGFLSGAQSALTGGALAGQQARAQGVQNVIDVGGQIAGAFSDPKLKSNMEIIGNISGVNVIRWDWNEAAFNAYGLSGESIGFDASEIKKSHPHHVTKDDSGTLKINYDDLLKELNNGH